MKTYNENDKVIYTDKNGKRFDTFVIFDTDLETGLTHINHYNLKVSSDELKLHPRSLSGGQPMPFSDAHSFLLYNQLKEKYQELDKKKAVVLHREIDTVKSPLAKAS